MIHWNVQASFEEFCKEISGGKAILFTALLKGVKWIVD